MINDLRRVFEEMLAGNLGADDRLDYFGVRIGEVSPDGSAFDLTLILKSGESYCCSELGCHLAYSEPDWWEELRDIMEDHGIRERPQLAIRKIRVIVQLGSRLRCRRDFGYPEESPRFAYVRGPFLELPA